ncbi:MAG TPA: methionyl-tRNA formyltransferase [Candidatus Omnitrophota bacterium]|nr:methionyl-tRNA formyltransferase [Candidatus Omnitrophota bacterium]HPD84123.1 methionyl-tRNA formyltransferase [Candidatus Omnitrophota bacterium]HRZ02980.1 methionyl-tRNA formyltransferase [Candidatus Omnitrophota bacterium]
MRIIFWGSDDFAVCCFKELLNAKHEVLACVTHPDKTKGRHLTLNASPVKDFAQKNYIPVLQPENRNDPHFIEQLQHFKSDLFVVISYGYILPAEVIAIPKIFSINVHGSLLPRYRGAAPINWAIINGDEATGVSVIKLDAILDAGEIILQKGIKIEKDDTSVTLRSKLSVLGAQCLLKALENIDKKDYTLTRQDPAKVTLAPKLTKEHGLIRWEEPAGFIRNHIRGLLPWPGAYTYYLGRFLKVLKADVIDMDPEKFSPGEVIKILPDGIMVVTGQGVLCLRQVHLESSKPMDIKNFLSGHKIGIGFRFGK